jgi:hypothetical protein
LLGFTRGCLAEMRMVVNSPVDLLHVRTIKTIMSKRSDANEILS